MEAEIALAFDRAAGERLCVRLQRECAALPAGQVILEVVDPVARVGPAAAALQTLGVTFAFDVEGVREPRVAERDHRLAETRRYLTDILCLPLRRKDIDAGGRSGRGC